MHAFSEAYGYEVYQKLSSGVEYDVVVGVGAVRSSNLVVANSSVRTFIPGKRSLVASYMYRTVQFITDRFQTLCDILVEPLYCRHPWDS